MNNCFSVIYVLCFFFLFFLVKKYNEGNECIFESMCKFFFLFCVYFYDLLYNLLIKIYIIYIEGILVILSCVYLIY